MSSDKIESLSEIWAARYDDRDDEELACQLWAMRLAQREQAMAQPISGFSMLDEKASGADPRQAANESMTG